MRMLTVLAVLVLANTTPAAAQMTDLERERLVAHLEMTAAWLEDEVSDLSPAQVEFRRTPGTWNVIEVLDHLVLVGQVYWDDLQRSVKGPPSTDTLAAGDAAILWYGVNRSNREPALPTEMPRGKLRDVAAALAEYRRHHTRLLEYIRTTKDDLRHRIVQRQACDAYQWALLISTHEQRHILQIREVKADQRFPRP
jgi:DinB superfamily